MAQDPGAVAPKVRQAMDDPTARWWRVGLPWLAAIVLVALGWKALLLSMDAFPFNADEAIVGLMARHILAGERPIFFYGQAYMGSLDAFLVAAAMSLFGRTVSSIRLVQSVLFAGTAVSTAILASTAFRSRLAGIAAGLLVAMPTVNVTLYTTVSLGGYGEALLIGNGLLLMVAVASSKSRVPGWLTTAWGLLAGFGFWAFGLTLIYIVPTGLALVLLLAGRAEHRRWRAVAFAGVGLVVGASPWIGYALTHGTRALVAELFGSAIAGASGGSLVGSLGSHIVNFSLFGPTVIMGLRPPWGTGLLSPYLAVVPILFWLSTLAFAGLRMRAEAHARPVEMAMIGVAAFNLLGFFFTPFGADPSGRYFLPSMIPMSFFGGGLLAWLHQRLQGWWAIAVLASVMIFNLVSTLDAIDRSPTGLTTQFDPIARVDQTELPSLIRFLEDRGIDRGYTNYWVAYPLAFRSDERLIFVPAVPYHLDFRFTPRDNRYPPYQSQVEASRTVAYITTNHPPLNLAIQAAFDRLSIEYQRAEVGPFTVFYDLTSPVRPSELNLPSGKG